MKKILVIEDVVTSGTFFLESLKSEGFDVISAENGVIGLQRAQQELPDLILSDIITPKLDGYGVLMELRRNPSTASIPLIFLTTKLTRADICKGIELGVDDYLIKPCSVEKLLWAIAACLEKRAKERKWYSIKSQPLSEPLEADTKPATVQTSIFPSVPNMSEVFQFIENHYHQPITLSDVAQVVGYSPAYLTNLMQQRTGRTLHQWIVERRMLEARNLLMQTNKRVEEIAQAVGYQHTVPFFRQFRQHHATTPQAWRNANLAKQN